MSNRWQGDERRSHPRVPLKSRVKEAVETVLPTSIVDISLSGALLEVPSTLSSQSRYVLRVPLVDGGSLELDGEVVRSYVHGFNKVTAGVPSVKYRAAIKFVEVSSEKLEALERMLGDSASYERNAELSG
jgi:PilZ domain